MGPLQMSVSMRSSRGRTLALLAPYASGYGAGIRLQTLHRRDHELTILVGSAVLAVEP